MKVLFIAPQAPPKVLDVIALDLATMQALVGGLVEAVGVGESDNGNTLYALVNEKGLLHGMFPNRVARGDARSATFVGNIVILSSDDEGEWAPLTNAECRRLADHIDTHWTKLPGMTYDVPMPTITRIP